MINIGKENERLEFKESTSLYNEAAKSIVAMLNSYGEAKVIFGVKDNGDVKGIQIGNDTISTLTDRLRGSIQPNFVPEIIVKKIDSKTIIELTTKSYNQMYSYKSQVYKRVGDKNILLDPTSLKNLIKEKDDFNNTWENRLLDYGIDKISIKSVESFYDFCIKQSRMSPFDHTTEELLISLNLMKGKKITNACYYLFGENGPISFSAVEYASTERINPIDLKKYSGGIFSIIDQVMSFIKSKMRWNIVIKDEPKRKEEPEIPLKAIREILINSLIHADYTQQTEHKVTFDPKYIEIYNPGIFMGGLQPKDYIEETRPSWCRHKKMQDILFKAFDIETLGRGLAVTNKICKQNGIKWEYKMIETGFKFIFIRPVSIISSNNLSKHAVKVLDELYIRNIDTIQEVCDIIQKKERTAQSVISELTKAKLIKRVGSDRKGYWTLAKQKK